MKALPHIVRKEFIQISRNKLMLPLLFVMPIVQLMILSFAADFEVRNLNLVVVDRDGSSASRELIEDFLASGYFTLTDDYQVVDEAMSALERDEADLILNVPRSMEQDLANGTPVGVQILLNAVNSQKASVAANYSQQVIGSFNNHRLMNLSLNIDGQIAPDFREAYWYNQELDYKTYMVPGILAILVTMLTAFLSSINIIREKEMGTIEQLNVTPIGKLEFILGKIIPFWLIGMFLTGFGLVVARVMFGISIEGSALSLFGFVAIYLVAVLGFGILISTVTETQQQAMFITWFFLVIFLLLSGLFTPVDSIPEWARLFNYVNPVKYFVEVMRMVMLKGSVMADLSKHFLVMTGFAIGANLIAILSYRKTSG